MPEDNVFNSQNSINTFTTFSDEAGTAIVTQILRTYYGLGQMTREYQSDSGAVDIETTRFVEYNYSNMASGANHSRLTSIEYPSGRTLVYNYSGTLNDQISRLSWISEGTTTHEAYEYLGSNMIVERTMRGSFGQSHIKLSSESVGDAGDQYTGLDRFNRIVDQRWRQSSTDLDRYQYGYDRDGNRLFRDNRLSTANGEFYAYDGMNRVATAQRGTLNSTRTGITGSPSLTQEWELDTLGNSSTIWTNGVGDNRAHNSQNELTSTSSGSPNYDSNGNMTTNQSSRTLRYDAWNRVVEQKNGSTSEIVYRYDGLGRRVREGSRTIYYSAQWQAIEERITSSGTLAVQYVWSPVYIDAMITRARDTDSNGTLDETIYIAHDANFNVTALFSTSGSILQRFRYDAYGKRTILTSSWSVTTTNSYVFYHGLAGGKIDSITNRVHFRNRDYDVDLMRWISRDPIGYKGSPYNLYEYVGSNPLRYVDPFGKARGIWNTFCEACQGAYQVGPFDAWGAADIWGIGVGADAQSFASQFSDGGQSNAARHCYWQAMLTIHYGSDEAEAIGNAHEYGEIGIDSIIDKLNNPIGRDIGLSVLGDKTISCKDRPGAVKDRCRDAILNGILYTTQDDPRLGQGFLNEATDDGWFDSSTDSSGSGDGSGSGDSSSGGTSSWRIAH